jgi:hypothetical protein
LGKKKKQKKALKKLQKAGIITADNVKDCCCNKYKKKESKRCSKCPRLDVIKKVA